MAKQPEDTKTRDLLAELLPSAPRPGRPCMFGAAMSPAERKRRSRASKSTKKLATYTSQGFLLV